MNAHNTSPELPPRELASWPRPLPVTLLRLLVTAILAAMMSGCAQKNRELQARLDAVSAELRAQQSQLQAASLQSTNLEQRLKKLETAPPDVGRVMLEIQLHFAKLYYAGEARNWDLARFERGEIEEALRTVIALRPEERGVNIAGIAQAFQTGPLTNMQEAIDLYNRPMFRKAYQDSIVVCNACHQSTGRPFISITIPTNPPVFNQRWEPYNFNQP